MAISQIGYDRDMPYLPSVRAWLTLKGTMPANRSPQHVVASYLAQRLAANTMIPTTPEMADRMVASLIDQGLATKDNCPELFATGRPRWTDFIPVADSAAPLF